MKIADICPLFFNPLKNKYKQDIDYVQKFYTTDKILIQAYGGDSGFTLKDLIEGTSKTINFLEFAINEGKRVKYATLTGLNDSVYSVVIGDQESETFEVTSSLLDIAETTIIKFSHKDNMSIFDNVFWIGEEQQFFEFRVECGISYENAKIENEQYRNQFQEIRELYAVPYDVYKLILGTASGLPYWYAQFINRVFCLSKVIISGVHYVRSGKSDVELSPISEESQMYNVSVSIEKVVNEASGAGGRPEYGVISAAILSNNPKDGQPLVYDETMSLYTNRDLL